MVTAAIFAIFPFCLALAAFNDLFSMTIPNRISLALLVSFVVLAPLSGMPVMEIGQHLLAGVLVLAVCLVFFAMRVMGGGDAKLLTAAAVWFGFGHALTEFAVYVSVFGGMLTLVILILRSQAAAIQALGMQLPGSLLLEKKIPYGIAIAIGGFIAYPSSPMMVALIGQ